VRGFVVHASRTDAVDRVDVPTYGAVVHPVVTVTGGRVRGVRRGDLCSFSGIPYGRAPVGDLRWRPPLPPEPWNDTRDAASFGPIAPQAAAVAGITSPSDPSAAEPQSEDCLSLNVWTPDVPDRPTRTSGTGRPVLVWIHGGGYTSGSGSVFLYRGGALVRNGGAVVVTLNYRLGALGFLGHRGLREPDGLVGNWGLHDQLAALVWVRDNIAVFGGDPGNVTVFGESAGAMSIAALLGVPSARGLFRRAVVQSGGVHVHTVEQAERSAERLVQTLGLARCDRASLVRVPADELVAATAQMAARRPPPGLLPLPFQPVVDGCFLPEHPLRAVEAGASAGVDLLIGTNRDELTLFGLGNPALLALDDAGVVRWVENAAPDMPGAAVVEAYREVRRRRGETVTPTAVWVAAGTDIVFRWPSLQLAAAQGAWGGRTFVYLFTWESPAFGGLLGSCHALELPFVFGAVHVPAVQLFSGGGPEADSLSRQMQSAWLAFARTGDPSHDRLGEWREWDPAARGTMIFGPRSGMEDAPRNDELSLFGRYRPLRSGVPD
jgi:para-nitrobenzyl esterase